uniref:Sodium:proton antiporter n=1 Tax=Ignisphaera aggregans TaxID=334771 RepID=A0A7C5XKN4_9CREN
MRMKDIIIAISLSLFVLATSFIIAIEEHAAIGTTDIRGLGKSYLYYSYNPWYEYLTSFSLNVVTAIIWDYRGFDTFYETCVLLASIVALISLFRGYVEKTGLPLKGLSDIVKTSTKLVMPLIVIYGAITALHGQLTPGGGFQGGAIVSVVTSLVIAIFSLEYVLKAGLSTRKLTLLRTLGVLCIAIIAVTPLIIAALMGVKAYVFQNMAKENSPVSMPRTLLDSSMAGSILFFNLFELIVAFSGLSTALIVLSLREDELREIFTVREHHE